MSINFALYEQCHRLVFSCFSAVDAIQTWGCKEQGLRPKGALNVFTEELD